MISQRQEAERYAHTIAVVRAFHHDDQEAADALLDGLPAEQVITDLIRFALILLATSSEPADDILDRLSGQANAILAAQ